MKFLSLSRDWDWDCESEFINRRSEMGKEKRENKKERYVKWEEGGWS